MTSPKNELTAGCRKCGKEFNALWRRGHACGHCGHEFCSGCLEGQALMPRRARSGAGPLAEIRGALRGQAQSTGYDVENVCMHCLGMLQGESAERRPKASVSCEAGVPLALGV